MKTSRATWFSLANELPERLTTCAVVLILRSSAASSAAHGAAVFYGAKKSDALALNCGLLRRRKGFQTAPAREQGRLDGVCREGASGDEALYAAA